MSYLETTFPSDYDTSKGWYCTIGKAELESAALHLTEYLQEHGDEWVPVPLDLLPPVCGYLRQSSPVEGTMVEMPERWLSRLQNVRTPRQGPPELIASEKAKGGLQLRWPNGMIKAASHEFSDEEMAKLRASRAHLDRAWYGVGSDGKPAVES